MQSKSLGQKYFKTMGKLVLFILLLFCVCCSNLKQVEQPHVYKYYKKVKYHYVDDKLQFECSFEDETLTPNVAMKQKPSFMDWVAIKNEVILNYKKQHTNSRIGYMSLVNASPFFSEYKSKLISNSRFLNPKIEENQLFEQLKDRKVDFISYQIKTKNQLITVAEYFIHWNNQQFIRVLELGDDTANKRAADILNSFNMTNLDNDYYSRITNSFFDYKYNYLNTIEKLYAIEDISDNQKSTLDNLKGLEASRIGAYKPMLEFRGNEHGDDEWSTSDSLKLEKYTPQDAKQSILEATKSRQVVMFNEHHLSPYPRVFMKSLLDSLRKQGFEYLGSETLVNNPYFDENPINKRGYPLQGEGAYIQEPCFGELLRHAQNIGFKLFAYERNTPCDSIGKYAKLNHREKAQAQNIAKILTINPDAKILIFAGHGHIMKTHANTKFIPMAAQFKMLTNIDPLCIEQAIMIEGFEPKKEHPAYRATMLKYKPQQSIVLTKGKEYWINQNDTKPFDIQVFHPRTVYEVGYPTWLLKNSGNLSYILKTPKKINLENTLMQVYVKKEYVKDYPNSIPVINRIVKGQSTHFLFNINKGEYIVIFIDKYRNILFQKTIIK